MNEHPTRNQAALPRDGGWLPAPTISRLRTLTNRYLDGQRAADREIREIARTFANATRDAGLPPERFLIAMRALWRDFGFSQADRLQLASLYDRLVRETIDLYYEH